MFLSCFLNFFDKCDCLWIAYQVYCVHCWFNKNKAYTHLNFLVMDVMLEFLGLDQLTPCVSYYVQWFMEGVCFQKVMWKNLKKTIDRLRRRYSSELIDISDTKPVWKDILDLFYTLGYSDYSTEVRGLCFPDKTISAPSRLQPSFA